MERQIAGLSDVPVGFADMSSAAGSDRDAPYRRPGETAASFRRPPASFDDLSSGGPALARPYSGAPFSGAGAPSSGAGGNGPDTGSWNAFAAGDAEVEPGRAGAWRADPGRLEGRARREAEDRWEAERQREERPEPPYGPAPPATNGRTAFGFTAGPISGHWRDGAPTSGAPAGRDFVPARRPPADRDDHIGDLVGDTPHEIRPHRATATAASAPRQGRGVMLAGLALTAAVLFGGTVAGIAYYSGAGDDGPGGVVEAGAAGAGGRTVDRTAAAPLEGRTKASFELVSAVTKVTVRSADLGDLLYRMTTAEDSGMVPKPVLERDGVQLNLAPETEAVPGTGEVEVTLSSKVTWKLLFSGGADEQQLDLEKGKIGAIDFQGGARRTSIRLPEAAGTVPVKVLGAVDELAMTSPTGNPVRVKVKGGAQTVAAGARTLTDIEPGSTITPRDWATDDRYDVSAESRVTLLTVDTRE